ncbi:MAG: carbohydrate-binding module 48 [Leptospiraceae bacterium]|nr:carbohydrate-binding module 48 [Leptospiraceae bacterium]
MATKKNKTPFIIIFSSLLLFGFGSLFSEEAIDWISSYSSKEIESGDREEVNRKKVYYYWQIQSLKRAVQPRYIRMLDIEHYRQNQGFLRKGVLFTFNGLKNSEVSICGNFNAWRCISMNRNRYGIYYTIIPADFKGRYENDISRFEYKFKVDGFFDYDPVNPIREEDGEGSYISVYNLEKYDLQKNVTYRIIDSEIEQDLDFKTVEFRIYKPQANTIALVGDFNQWNPEHDYLNKSPDGTFTLRKKLKPGEYLYYFIIDGKTTLDTYNSETRFQVETKELCSYLMIETRDEYIEIAKEP